MSAGTLTIALAQQMGLNGQPLAGALLYTYVAGSVNTPQNTYADQAMTIVNQFPLPADQYGRFPMFYLATGTVHIRMTDKYGTVIFDYLAAMVIT